VSQPFVRLTYRSRIRPGRVEETLPIPAGIDPASDNAKQLLLQHVRRAYPNWPDPAISEIVH
jgi:hypothetical protein